MVKINVYELRVKVYTLADIPISTINKNIDVFIDNSLAKNEKLIKWHNENVYKYYSRDSLYPIAQNGFYHKDKVYTLTVRCVDEKLADFFLRELKNICTNTLKGLTAEIRILPKKYIEQIYTLTPIVIKNERGYWRKIMTLDDFERRLKDNLFKKYKSFTKENFDENFEFYTSVEFLNKIPIATEYKGIKLIGDKIRLRVAENPTAQKLAYFALGVGLGEMNARGMGFVNYRWL